MRQSFVTSATLRFGTSDPEAEGFDERTLVYGKDTGYSWDEWATVRWNERRKGNWAPLHTAFEETAAPTAGG